MANRMRLDQSMQQREDCQPSSRFRQRDQAMIEQARFIEEVGKVRGRVPETVDENHFAFVAGPVEIRH